MEEYKNIETKIYRGNGFMTISKYNNSGELIYIADKDSKAITCIETFNYSIVGTFEGHTGVIWNLDISKDDLILISCSGDLTICFFDTIEGKKLHQLQQRCIPKYICTQKNQKTNLVAIICEALTKKTNTYISIYDLEKINSEDFIEITKLNWNYVCKPNIILWLNEENLIIGCDDGKIILRNINDIDGNYDKEYKFHEDSIKSLIWNKTFNKILTSSLDCTSKTINTENWEIISIYYSTVPINWACWNHNEKKVFIGGGIEAMNVAKTSNNDLNLKIYRTSDQKLTNHIGSHFGPIRYIDMSPNSKNFISASQDGTVKIYFIKDEQDTKKIENTDCTEKTFKKFGNIYDTIYLNDEIIKMLNLNWKPSSIKKTEKKINWIPGMPKPTEINTENKSNKNLNSTINNSELFEINSSTDLDKKFENLNKDNESNNSTIRITNLPTYIKHKELYDLFDLYGRIEEKNGIKIIDYENNTIAFIKYVYPESAIKAINNMDKSPIDYNIITVEFAKQK